MRYLFLSFLLALSLNAEVVLEVSGFGTTKKEAQTEALRTLSQTVVSKVDSSYHKQERVNGSGYSKTQDVDLKISSDITFKGVEYTPIESAGEQVEIRATLSAKALDETLDYMLTLLEGDHSQLSKAALKEHTKYIEHLYALLELTKNYSGVYKYEDLKSQLQLLKEQNNKELNYGRVIIVSEGSITLDDSVIERDKLYFYAPGTYRYTVMKKGCVKEEGKLHLYKAKVTKREITLVCNKTQVKNFSLDVDQAYVDIAIDTITKYGFFIENSSANKIEISMRELNSFEVDQTRFYTYKVYLKIILPGRTISKKATLKNVTSQTVTTKMSRLLPLLLKAGLKEF